MVSELMAANESFNGIGVSTRIGRRRLDGALQLRRARGRVDKELHLSPYVDTTKDEPTLTWATARCRSSRGQRYLVFADGEVGDVRDGQHLPYRSRSRETVRTLFELTQPVRVR